MEDAHRDGGTSQKRRDHVCGYCKGVAFGRASTLKKHIDVVH